jgi:hypothetical protein
MQPLMTKSKECFTKGSSVTLRGEAKVEIPEFLFDLLVLMLSLHMTMVTVSHVYHSFG